jgi:hypothetical protein
VKARNTVTRRSVRNTPAVVCGSGDSNSFEPLHHSHRQLTDMISASAQIRPAVDPWARAVQVSATASSQLATVRVSVAEAKVSKFGLPL